MSQYCEHKRPSPVPWFPIQASHSSLLHSQWTLRPCPSAWTVSPAAAAPLCPWVQLSDTQQLEFCRMSCTSVQALCFMRGFLPHPNSKEFKHHIVIAKLHDATFAEVVRSFYWCLCSGYWIKDSSSAGPLALNTPQLPAPSSPCNKNLSWATERVSVLEGISSLLSLVGCCDWQCWSEVLALLFYFPGFLLFSPVLFSFHVCLTGLLMGIPWDSQLVSCRGNSC